MKISDGGPALRGDGAQGLGQDRFGHNPGYAQCHWHLWMDVKGCCKEEEEFRQRNPSYSGGWGVGESLDPGRAGLRSFCYCWEDNVRGEVGENNA